MTLLSMEIKSDRFYFTSGSLDMNLFLMYNFRLWHVELRLIMH